MNKPSTTPLALSAKDAALSLGISERTLWASTQPRGPIPSIKLGGRVLYPVAGLEEWLTRAAAEQLSAGKMSANPGSPGGD
ncbi:Helix-turn-helix domain protein [Gimesia maris]|uniref:helix-turn-helix domain-containing protein n=1 Tax=Gimesia maris TaxID=122 RepID=UPI00118A55E6|nr:helix-turn-helix domain-containing protein [Gimesia maris]QDT81992.1 Helix-turn-helix domain protein [Gimesia maris]